MIEVTPIDWTGGSSVLVANAARTSLAKHHDVFDNRTDTRLVQYLYKKRHWAPFAHPTLCFKREISLLGLVYWLQTAKIGCETEIISIKSRDGVPVATILDVGSLWFWLENIGKMEPYSHVDTVFNAIWQKFPEISEGLELPYPLPSAGNYSIEWVPMDEIQAPHFKRVTFRVAAAIPIRTQCFKSKYGFVESEESRRYVKKRPNFFTPEEWREAAPNLKQGSLEVHIPDYRAAETMYKNLVADAGDMYELLVEDQGFNMCAEQARFFMPQGMITTWYWTGTLAAYARFVYLRTEPSAQAEVRDIASRIEEHLTNIYGDTWFQVQEMITQEMESYGIPEET